MLRDSLAIHLILADAVGTCQDPTIWMDTYSSSRFVPCKDEDGFQSISMMRPSG